tara:strand:+ start:136 stop:444 length:309 start_codon:yes stop_codon:yes gene_type:complete
MNLRDALQHLANNPAFAAIEEWLSVVGWKPGVETPLIEAFLSLANDSADEETCAQWRGDLDALDVLYQKRLSLQPAGTEAVGGDSIDNNNNNRNDTNKVPSP